MTTPIGDGISTIDVTSVHVWRIRLVQPEPVIEALRELLSDDEIERANRFHFQRDRRRFIVTRGAVRTILAKKCGLGPEAIRFVYQERGKPELAAETSEQCGLFFNVSHSGELALCATTTHAELGVDVEQVRTMSDALAVSERFFSSQEREALRRVPPRDLSASFFRIWTRKEAFLKARGLGITMPLDQFSVPLDDSATRLLEVRWDRSETQRWRLTHLEPRHGYTGALATPFWPVRVEWRDWSFDD